MGAVLGVSCDYHDAAAAIVVDGTVEAACQEERLSRVKHDASLPTRSIASVLAISGVAADDLDAVVFYEKPLDVVSRFFATRQRQGPSSLGPFVRDLPTLVGRNLMIGDRLDRCLRQLGASTPPRVSYCEHHLSHAAAAFYPSPFGTAATLTIDGVGEHATATIGRAGGEQIDLIEEVRFPSSIGLLYSLVTVWCGFAANDGEFKVMGLAPYGRPRFADQLRAIARVQPGGGPTMDARRVRWWSGDPTRRRALVATLGGPPRRPGEPLTERDTDLAASIQVVTEEAVLSLAQRAHELSGEAQLCMAGGVALNCVANARLVADGPFDDVWVQPAAGDAGSALGAALWAYHQRGGVRPPLGDRVDRMRGAALGPRFADGEVERRLDALGVRYRTLDEGSLIAETARRLAEGAVVGWFEGRMEFGPRSLGHRSILADARGAGVQADLNRRVKGREGFRPFAPSVPWADAREWFTIDRPSPYMLRTVPVHPRRMVVPSMPEPTDPYERASVPRSTIPACTHIDGTARVQTVDRADHPRFHDLLVEFGRLTGYPVLLNTSFNVADEPIVATPDDALLTARAAGLDVLVIERCVVDRPVDVDLEFSR